VNLTNPEVVLDTRNIAASDDGLLRVITSDGLNSTWTDLRGLKVSN
jgi:hypothetical protein